MAVEKAEMMVEKMADGRVEMRAGSLADESAAEMAEPSVRS